MKCTTNKALNQASYVLKHFNNFCTLQWTNDTWFYKNGLSQRFTIEMKQTQSDLKNRVIFNISNISKKAYKICSHRPHFGWFSWVLRWYSILRLWTHMTADADKHMSISLFSASLFSSEKHLFKVCIDVAKVWRTFQCRKSLQVTRLMRHSVSVFRCFHSLLLDLFATVHSQSCNGVWGENHNGAPDEMRRGSSRRQTHRSAGINRIWDAHRLTDGLHVCSAGVEKSLRTADRCMDTWADLFIRAMSDSQHTSDPERETPLRQ